MLEKQLKQENLRNKIIAEILLPQEHSKYVNDFLSIIKNDFIQFTEQTQIKRAIAYYNELLSIGDTVKEITTLPQLYKYNKIAVAGSFSAGKSEFISSLFKNDKIHLPTSIEPTTAIPTYIIHSNKDEVYAKQLISGGVINLSKINQNIYSYFSHQFLNNFGFNIKTIMPYLCLSTPLVYKNICLLDTPGYNPSSTMGGYTGEDAQSAFNFSQKADAIIWLVGLDANGTLSKSDIDFLQNLQDQETKPLYIILNKADTRPITHIEDVMETIVDTLDDYDIDYEGVSAYSSTKKKEYTHFRKSLTSFLMENSRVNLQARQHIISKLFDLKNNIIEDNQLSGDSLRAINTIFRSIDLCLEQIFSNILFTLDNKQTNKANRRENSKRECRKNETSKWWDPATWQ